MNEIIENICDNPYDGLLDVYWQLLTTLDSLVVNKIDRKIVENGYVFWNKLIEDFEKQQRIPNEAESALISVATHNVKF